MASSFETSDSNSGEFQRPLKVASRREHIFVAAKEMAVDMKGWQLDGSDEEAMVLHCTKKGGALGGTSKITVTVEGSVEVPSTTVNCKCETQGGLMARPKATVEEFMKLLFRRVC
ncbi:MAG: hypothetical protein P1V81_11385 [Planctomycetota bacterium]|nr:hypothetical protein [Planctomycetota bacterium]